MGKTRGAGVDGQYNVVYEYREEDVGLEAGRIAVALVNHLVAPDGGADSTSPTRSERLILTAERQRLRAVDAGARRRGGLARHPVHPPRPPLAWSSSARASTSSASGRR